MSALPEFPPSLVAKPEPISGAGSDSSALRPVRVFLVEDNFHVRDNLAAALEELAPLRVVGRASDVRVAVDWLRHDRTGCDLILVDPFLRSGSGFAILETARRARPTAMLVALGNDEMPGVRASCLAAGARYVLDPSRDIDLLVSFCMKLALERHPAGQH